MKNFPIKRKKGNQEVICYECMKPGHMKTKCLKLKRNPRFKKRSLMAMSEDSWQAQRMK